MQRHVLAALLLLTQISLVVPCMRFSRTIEEKLASLAAIVVPSTSPAPTTPKVPPSPPPVVVSRNDLASFPAPKSTSTEPPFLVPRLAPSPPVTSLLVSPTELAPSPPPALTARQAPPDVSSTTSSPETSSTEGPRLTTPMYTDRYDFVSIEHVLRSPRLMRNFHQCMMGRGPCTREGSELRRIVPEALRSECARCTERQRVQAGKVLAFLLEHRRDWWQELLDKFDADGAFRRQYEYEMDDLE